MRQSVAGVKKFMATVGLAAALTMLLLLLRASKNRSSSKGSGSQSLFGPERRRRARISGRPERTARATRSSVCTRIPSGDANRAAYCASVPVLGPRSFWLGLEPALLSVLGKAEQDAFAAAAANTRNLFVVYLLADGVSSIERFVIGYAKLVLYQDPVTHTVNKDAGQIVQCRHGPCHVATLNQRLYTSPGCNTSHSPWWIPHVWRTQPADDLGATVWGRWYPLGNTEA